MASGLWPIPLTMAFQPIVDLHEHRIVGHEALVRGRNREGADAVLAQVTPLNRSAFNEACRTTAIGLAASLGLDRRLSVNLLPDAVHEPGIGVRRTLETAALHGFPAQLITVELLETEHSGSLQTLVDLVREYRAHGLLVALDDFGVGWSSLSRLADLHPDVVKIDRALITGCDSDRVRLEIVASIVRLARAIDVRVVAEGAETYSEVVALRSVGVRYVQGYYFAKPLFEGLVFDEDIPWLPNRTALA